MGYLRWALLALAAYSLVAPLLKLAIPAVPSEVAVFVSNAVVLAAAAVLVVRRDHPVRTHLRGPKAPHVLATGVLLAVALLAFYRALAVGPVSVVVPVYGLFIVASSVVGVAVLDEQVTPRKAAGVLLAVVAIYLTST